MIELRTTFSLLPLSGDLQILRFQDEKQIFGDIYSSLTPCCIINKYCESENVEQEIAPQDSLIRISISFSCDKNQSAYEKDVFIITDFQFSVLL